MRVHRAIARCHQHALPVIDRTGREIREGMSIRFRQGHLLAGYCGTILHLFDFGDTDPPEIEVQVERAIYSTGARLTGGCWRFDSLVTEPTS